MARSLPREEKEGFPYFCLRNTYSSTPSKNITLLGLTSCYFWHGPRVCGLSKLSRWRMRMEILLSISVVEKMKTLASRAVWALAPLCLAGCFAGGFGIVHVPHEELSRIDQIVFTVTSPTGDCAEILGDAWLIYKLSGQEPRSRTNFRRISEGRREVILQAKDPGSIPILMGSHGQLEYFLEFDFDGRIYRYPDSGMITVRVVNAEGVKP